MKKLFTLLLFVILTQAFINPCYSQSSETYYVDWDIKQNNLIIGSSLIVASLLEAIIIPVGEPPVSINYPKLSNSKFPYHLKIRTKLKSYTETDSYGRKIKVNVGRLNWSNEYNYYGKYSRIDNDKFRLGSKEINLSKFNTKKQEIQSIDYYNLKEEVEHDNRKQLKLLITLTTAGVGFFYLGAGLYTFPVEEGTGLGYDGEAIVKWLRITCYTLGGTSLAAGIYNFFVPNKSQKAWNVYKRKHSSDISMKISPAFLEAGNKHVKSTTNKIVYAPGLTFNLSF